MSFWGSIGAIIYAIIIVSAAAVINILVIMIPSIMIAVILAGAGVCAISTNRNNGSY